MLTFDKEPAKFYMNFKVHKEHEYMKPPPPRPIVSGSGSKLENIGKYIEQQIKQNANKHDTYIQDTPDFLRAINKVKNLGENAILVTMDVKALFTNIQHEEGIKCLQEELEERKISEVPADYITKLMELLLKYNIFEFHEELYSQDIGAPMGAPPVPPYADIFMARGIDSKIKKIDPERLKLLKRFLDDIFMIYSGSTKNLHNFFEAVNKINSSIQFTMSHTSIKGEPSENKCECSERQEIPFLDLMCSIKEGRIETDLFRKKTDRNQYLLPSSCHPRHTTLEITSIFFTFFGKS